MKPTYDIAVLMEFAKKIAVALSKTLQNEFEALPPEYQLAGVAIEAVQMLLIHVYKDSLPPELLYKAITEDLPVQLAERLRDIKNNEFH